MVEFNLHKPERNSPYPPAAGAAKAKVAMRPLVPPRQPLLLSCGATKPIGRLVGSGGGVINCRRASQTCFNCARVLPTKLSCRKDCNSVFCSKTSSLAASSWLAASAFRPHGEPRGFRPAKPSGRGRRRCYGGVDAPTDQGFGRFYTAGIAERSPRCSTNGSKSLSLYSSTRLLAIQRVAITVSIVLRIVIPRSLSARKFFAA